MLTTAQVVETSVIVCNSPNEYYKLIWTNIPYVLYYNLLSSLYLVLERFSWNQTFLTSQFLKWYPKRRSTLMIRLYVGDEGFLNILIWADSFMSP